MSNYDGHSPGLIKFIRYEITTKNMYFNRMHCTAMQRNAASHHHRQLPAQDADRLTGDCGPSLWKYRAFSRKGEYGTGALVSKLLPVFLNEYPSTY
jgi:hypothetical protein